jgi:UDP-3-O-[3-hydroxymyristoyl] glucosamine N-acyltransferase
MNINQIQEFNKNLEIQLNGPKEFLNLGTLASTEKSLLTYCNNSQFLKKAVNKNNVVAAFVKKEDAATIDADISFIISKIPSIDFFLLHNYLANETDFYNIDRPSIISDSAEIHSTAVIAEKNVEIGNNVIISPNVVILENTTIQSGVYISAGAVIGEEGTQTIKLNEFKNLRIAHAGGVVIGENTFIGPNAVIAKSLFREPTKVGRNVSIGSLTNIGHNCKIGDNAMILPNSCVSGSTVVEEGAVIAPGAVISSSRRIGENARVTLGSVVTKDVEPGTTVSGNFAIEHSKFLAHIKKVSK